MATKMVKITNTPAGGVVSPDQTPVAQGDEVQFTIDSGKATVFIADSADFTTSPPPIKKNSKQPQPVKIPGDQSIHLTVTEDAPTSIWRVSQGRMAASCSILVYIDGAQAYATGVDKMSTPVLILDPP